MVQVGMNRKVREFPSFLKKLLSLCQQFSRRMLPTQAIWQSTCGNLKTLNCFSQYILNTLYGIIVNTITSNKNIASNCCFSKCIKRRDTSRHN